MLDVVMLVWICFKLICLMLAIVLTLLFLWLGFHRCVQASAEKKTELATRSARRAEDQAHTLFNALNEETQKRRQAESREREAQRLAEAAEQDAQRAKEQFSCGGKNLAEIDEFLREGKMLFSRTGKVVTARVFASPTGRVGIEWMVSHDGALPPAVEIRRGYTLVANEHAYRGVHIDQLRRGQEYIFKIDVYAGARGGSAGHRLEEGFVIPVRVPTPKEWQRTVSKLLGQPDGGDDQRQARRKKLEAFLEDQVHRGQTIKELEGKIKGLGLDQEQEQTILAKVEAWMACEDERQEGEAKA